MSESLKAFLKENRGLVEQEEFDELLKLCPPHLRDELKELLTDTAGEFEEAIKLDPESLVAWWDIGRRETMSPSEVHLTKLKDAKINNVPPYQEVRFPYGKYIERVAKYNGDYYIVDSKFDAMIKKERAKAARKKRAAEMKASGESKYRSYLYRLRKAIEAVSTTFESFDTESFVSDYICVDISRDLIQDTIAATLLGNETDVTYENISLSGSVSADTKTLNDKIKYYSKIELSQFETYDNFLDELTTTLETSCNYLRVTQSKKLHSYSKILYVDGVKATRYGGVLRILDVDFRLDEARNKPVILVELYTPVKEKDNYWTIHYVDRKNMFYDLSQLAQCTRDILAHVKKYDKPAEEWK